MWNVKTKRVIRGNWNRIKIIQKIPEQQIGKAGHEGTKKNSHIGHCAHNAESVNVIVQSIQHGEERYMHHKL
jgi:hypothetical protein